MKILKQAARGLLGRRRRDAYRVYYHSMVLHRRLTARRRRLPDFLIIGAQKCGTSSLYAYLSKHPQVLPAFKKEVNFFTEHHHRGSRWYRAFFPTDRHPLETGAPRTVTGEATPDYLFHRGVPRRVAELVPGVKVIVLLRDPVRRAFSHYQHNRRFGFERRSFEEAIEAEMARLVNGGGAIDDDAAYADPVRRRFSYLARGCYLQQLEAWLGYFPLGRMLVIRSEDLFRDPAATYAAVLEYLAIDPSIQPSFPVHNEGTRDAVMQRDFEPLLRSYYAPLNDALSARLGREIGW